MATRPTGPRAYLIAFALAPALLVAAGLLPSAHAKMERIEKDQAAPGSRITLTAGELTAYAREQAGVVAPGGVHNALLTITPGQAEASASINFLRLRASEGIEDNWLMQKLLDGERPVHVRVRIASSNGRARVDIERVEVSGVAIEGSSLEFLLRHFVIPSFPDARVGEWFRLGHRIERLNLRTGAVDVQIASSR